MKKVIILTSVMLIGISFFFLFQACNKVKEEKSVAVPIDDNEFFKNNVSFFDARIRSISKTDYVREIYLVNLSNKEWKKTEQTYENIKFKDDGTGYDQKANDGIFTSVITFPHDNRIAYNENALIRSVLSNPIVSPQYKYQNELDEFSKTYPLRDQGQGKNGDPTINNVSITCDVEWVCGCWNTCCGVYVSNCKATIGF